MIVIGMGKYENFSAQNVVTFSVTIYSDFGPSLEKANKVRDNFVFLNAYFCNLMHFGDCYSTYCNIFS